MTKEELEKEAEEKYSEVDREFIDCQDEGEVFNIGYILGAEPREKQIQIDAEQIRALQKQNGELTDKVKELENRIEGYKNQIFYKEKALDKVKRDRDRIVHRVTKDKKRLIRRNIEFKAQIEKMRNCANCKNYNDNEGFCVLGSDYGYNCNLEKWEIKEK